MENKRYTSCSEKASEFRSCIKWIGAIDSWDHCDGELLAGLIINEDIPVKLKPIIANIVSGKRKQNKKAAVSLKVPASERVYIAHDLLILLGLIDELKSARTGEQSLLEWSADKNGIEPIESQRWLQEQAREIKKDAADQLGVTVATVESLLSDVKQKQENYPDI